MRFALTIIAPPNYPHSMGMLEAAESVHYGLVELGHDSTLTTSEASAPDLAGRRQIVLGCNLLPGYPVKLGEDAILYNLEQVTPDSNWFPAQMLELFRRHRVWDYSRGNIERLSALGITNVGHLPIGYVPQLTRIAPASQEDVDVFFFGSMNDRRKRALQALAKRGAKVKVAFGVYGRARDELVARSKIIVNLHYYDAKVFELVRVSYMLANRRFVVSERGSDPSEEAEFAGGVAFTDYDRFADTCIEYLARPDERARIAHAGFEIMAARPMSEYLRSLIDA